MSTPTVHVMSLSPEHQLALRLILNNHFKLQLKFMMEYLILNPQISSVTKKWDYIKNLFDMYEDLTSNFPTPPRISPTHKTRMFMFKTLALTYMKAALQKFDPEDNAGLEEEAIAFIMPMFDDIKKLVEKSMGYEYTLDEIRRAQK